MPEIDVHETFIGPEVARFISGQVETFCGVVGNQNEAYKLARTTKVKAPMEFAIVTGWQVNKPLRISSAALLTYFPSYYVIDEDLLKLVRFKTVSNIFLARSPLRLATLYRRCSHFIREEYERRKGSSGHGMRLPRRSAYHQITSSFLYYGCFIDFENTFESMRLTMWSS